ncbi:DM DNA binding domain protein [Dictyocaulus viviparus]|uniref:DM DNA binding domain protein n=1 Tax=Dictyocaulus viviparus TaxID=29172 RepID=A0A0D8XQ46_DICVI|nr:DM DNA binding domain protein [Dictyocaulus viviparus]
MHNQEESEIDVVALSPAPSQNSYNNTQNEKKYFCQRCLNHDLQYPRKGHKPVCKYASCTCSDCIMVEQRRQLNNMLSKSKLQLVESPRETAANGRRVRDPQCARCRQHGIRVPLRGHKRVLCQFANCKCEMCELVEDRRSLMAKQIKLRRDQQRQRNIMDDRHSLDSIGENDIIVISVGLLLIVCRDQRTHH